MLWARWAEWVTDPSLEVRGSSAAGRMPRELVSVRGLEVKVPRTSRLQAGSILLPLVGNRRLAL